MQQAHHNKFAKTFVASNSPYKKLQVLEVVPRRPTRNAPARMVIYGFRIIILGDHAAIMAIGWMLDDKKYPVQMEW